MTPDPIVLAAELVVAFLCFALGYVEGARAQGADPLLPLKRSIARALKRLAARFHR